MRVFGSGEDSGHGIDAGIGEKMQANEDVEVVGDAGIKILAIESNFDDASSPWDQGK